MTEGYYQYKAGNGFSRFNGKLLSDNVKLIKWWNKPKMEAPLKIESTKRNMSSFEWK